MKIVSTGIRIICLIICLPCIGMAQVPVNGYVYDAETGESLIGVSIFTRSGKAFTTSNAYGYFCLMKQESDSLCFRYLGYVPVEMAAGVGEILKIKLRATEGMLKEVEVTAKSTVNHQQETRLDMQFLNQMPVPGGERDVLKAVQFLPGYKKGADGTVGLMVRGGAMDQNLILLDDAPVYNPSHLLGFFSLFNADAVREVKIQSGGFHPVYGGRLSSVLDIRMNDGNDKSLSVTGSAGLLASSMLVQGPLPGGQGSFLVAGRISYINRVYDWAGKDLPFYFYDLNAKINWKLSNRDRMYVSLYQGDDVMDATKKDTSDFVSIRSNLGNRIMSMRWNHAYRDQKTFSNFTFFNSTYRYQIDADMNENSMQISAGIEDVGMRFGLTRKISNNIQIDYGMEFIHHSISPASAVLSGEFNDNLKDHRAKKMLLEEGAGYVSLKTHVGKYLEGNAGLRLSAANADQTTYLYPEPRIHLQWNLNSKMAFTTSYARMTQYMFLLSSGSTVLPTDLWYSVTKDIKPQRAEIITLGLQFQSKVFSYRIEGYYKPMYHLVEYREGTTELVDTRLEKVVVQGQGRAYGMEFTEQVASGKWSVNAAYTLSWSNRTFQELNQGKMFPARYDRRHDFTVVANYRFTPRIAFNLIWSYATGSNFTPVTGQFLMPNGNLNQVDVLPIFGARNSLKLSDAHKLDLGMILKSNPNQKYTWELHLGAYNVYNQTQPYRLKLIEKADGSLAYKQVGLFGFIPSMSYRFKF